MMNARLKTGVMVFILGFAVLAAGSAGLASMLIQASSNQAQTFIQPAVQIGYVGSNQPTTIPQDSTQSFTALSVIDSSGAAVSYAQARFTITVTLSTNDQTFTGTVNIQYSGSATVSATSASTPISGSTQGTVSYLSPTVTYQTSWTQFTASQMFSGSPANNAQSVITWPLSVTATLNAPTGTITKTASSTATFTAQWKQDQQNTYAVSVNVTPSTSTSTTTSTQTSTSTSTSTSGGALTVRQIAVGGYCIAWSPAISVTVWINPAGTGWLSYSAPSSYANSWCYSSPGPLPHTIYISASGYGSSAAIVISQQLSVVRLSILNIIQNPTAYPEFILYVILIAVGAGMMITSVPMFLKRRR